MLLEKVGSKLGKKAKEEKKNKRDSCKAKSSFLYTLFFLFCSFSLK